MPIAFTTSRMVPALVVTTGDEVMSAESSIRGQGMFDNLYVIIAGIRPKRHHLRVNSLTSDCVVIPTI